MGKYKEKYREVAGGVAQGGFSYLLIAQPIIALVLIIIGIFLGGIALVHFFQYFTNLWLWSITIIILGLIWYFDKKVEYIGSSLPILIGLLYWISLLAPEILNPPWYCGIPLLGGLVCGGINFVLLPIRLFMLGVIIGTVMIQMWIITIILKVID